MAHFRNHPESRKLKMKFLFSLLTMMALIVLATFTLVVTSFAQSGADLPFMPDGILRTGQVPVNGTDEVQTITLTNFSAGTLRLTLLGKSTVLTFGAADTNAAIDTAVDAALEAMGVVGAGGTTVATSGTTSRAIVVTFTGNMRKLDIPTIVATVLTGTNTVGVAVTTPGVTADGRSAITGQLLMDGAAGVLYSNTSTTPLAPTWVKVGAQ